MNLQQTIRHNLEFLQTEVVSRLESIKPYLDDTTPEAAENIFERGGYIASLKQRIHEACYRYLAESDHPDNPDVLRVRAIDIIATELERIAELGEDFVQQSIYLEDPRKKNFPRLRSQIDLVIEAVLLVHTALFENDTQIAIRIGRTQERLERKTNIKLRKSVA